MRVAGVTRSVCSEADVFGMTGVLVHAFDYHAPTTLSDALKFLAEHAHEAKPLAGGTDLIDQMRLGRHTPHWIIDVKKIPELNELTIGADGLRIGGAVPCYRIYSDPLLGTQFAALADSCRIIGGMQIQSRASLAGNLCNSGPAADSIPAMIALGGRCLIASAKGHRVVAVESFCTGPGQNVLQPGELVVALTFPAQPPHSGSHYRRMIPRNEMDIAVVGVGASVQLDASGDTVISARLALGAVAPTPLFAELASRELHGKTPSESLYQRVAELAQAMIAPISDLRGTREYRIHATGVLVKRVLEFTVARARGENPEFRAGH